MVEDVTPWPSRDPLFERIGDFSRSNNDVVKEDRASAT